tara:strand:+ start:293 stop:565 length:273 start_codon:yes stop_codon:yes gene_type:complete
MNENLDLDELQDIADQLLLASCAEDNVPHCILSGSGQDWFWCPQTKQMTMALRGTEVVFISEYSSHQSIVMSHGNILIVSNDDVIEVGYN